MKRVLNIIPTDFIKAAGMSQAEVTGPDNIVYNLYFPSTSCSPGLTLSQNHYLFSTVDYWIFDYVTIHDGDFSYAAIRAIAENLHRLKYSDDARINMPVKLGGVYL